MVTGGLLVANLNIIVEFVLSNAGFRQSRRGAVGEGQLRSASRGNQVLREMDGKERVGQRIIIDRFSIGPYEFVDLLIGIWFPV